MKRLALAAIAILTSCSQAPDPNANNPQSGPSVTNPVGRYQMMQGMKPAWITVLDTRFGTLQNCILVNDRYHCLSQDRSAETEGGIPDPPDAPN